jgi:hypothetical protein
MPYESAPINKLRVDDIYTLDKLIGIRVEHDNQQNTLGIDKHIIIPKPYFLHDLRNLRTRQVKKADTLDLGLSSIFDMLKDKNTSSLVLSDDPGTENFRRTTYIEFFAEDGIDTPYLTSIKFFEEANAALKDIRIKVSGEEYSVKLSSIAFHSSYRSLDTNSYSQYLMLITDKDSDIIITPQIEKFRI